MGNHVSHPHSTSVDALASEIPNFVQEKRIGSARFMKSIRGKSSYDQPMVLKVFVKPSPDFEVTGYIKTANVEVSLMNEIPHLCPYIKIIENEKAVYMLRPYFHSNLYDRISTRPFLEPIERKWIAFQLITAVASLHQLNLCHGDIKIENVMITSWNAVYLVDFASFKPVSVPIDNPADFVYFFDSSSRRTCYLAPERFSEISLPKLTEAMDIFSLGCVIAELFLEGTPLFHLSHLLKYQKMEYDPKESLIAIEDDLVIEMVKKMVHLDPLQRPSARSLLDTYRTCLFPDSFYTTLSSFVHNFATPSLSDPICPGDLPYSRSDLRILFLTTLAPLPSSLSLLVLDFITPCIPSLTYPCTAIQSIELLISFHLDLSDTQRLDRILPYFCYLLQHNPHAGVKAEALKAITTLLLSVQTLASQGIRIFTELLFPIFSKFVIYGEELVRATFAYCLADLADISVKFLEMGHSAIHQGESNKTIDPLYSLQNFDVFLADIQRTFLEYLQLLISDESNFVRKAFLAQATRLCVFFGRQTANDVILSHIITYLNDKDRSLKSAFFESMAGVGTVTGANSLHEYVLPLLLQSLHDPCAMVTDRALNALSALVELELFKKFHLRSILYHCSPFLLHPNIFLRYSSVAVICACSRVLQSIDLACLLSPIIAPFVICIPPYQSITPTCLLRILKPPILHETLEIFLNSNSDKSISKSEQEKIDLLKPMLPKLPLIPFKSAYDHSISMQSLNAALHTLFLSPSSSTSSTSPFAYKETKNVNFLPEKTLTTPLSMYPKRRNSVLNHLDVNSKAPSETLTVPATVTANINHITSTYHSITKKEDTGTSWAATSPTLEPWQSQYEGKNSYLRHLLMIKTNDLMLSMNVPRLFPSLQDWRLHGTLMVHLTEHTAPIVQLSVPNDDHGFFFSCSNDGTVKLWALHRLFKNWSTKSSLTYTMQGKVTCIASVSPTYFACGSNQNVVHVVEIQAKGIRVLHVLNFEGVEIPLFLRFFQTDASALLIVITSASFIYGYSSGDCIFKLTCPLAYGVISSVLVDYNSHWLLIGTSRGLLLLFDLRLHLLISKWMHPSRSHIHQLCCHPILEDHVIISTGKNEVSIWNLVSSQFTHVLCRQLPTIPYEPLSIPRPKDFIQSALRAFEESPSWEGYYSMYAPRGSPYVILAGTDRKIRIWKFMEKQVSILCHEDEENGDWGFSHQQHDSISFLIETPPSASKKNKGIIGFTLKESKQSVHHLDTITDLHVLHASFPILVTCSRDTTIKLWK